MNPYEATFPRIIARVGAWVRGLARRYRRQLLIVLAATATLAAGVAAGQAPTPAVAATR